MIIVLTTPISIPHTNGYKRKPANFILYFINCTHLQLHVDGNASKPHIMIFVENEIFTEYTILYKVAMACTKIRMQSPPKIAKIEVATIQSLVCFETVFLCFLNMVHFAYARF